MSYPLYDAHGNMISTLSKNGSGYTYSALRVFDAWGRVRVGATTGDPKGRYCASLGHRQDDESDLVYMRARYYEPGSGRFISEDPAMQGMNWYSYCGGDPVNRVDISGRSADEIEDIVKAMLGKGVISRSFYDFFMNRASGIRDQVHRIISGQNMSEAEIMEEIEFFSLEHESGIVLETAEEVASDLAAGLDISDLVLMEEVLILDETSGL